MDARIIGRFEGKETGPLLICIGGMHGNEPAGIEAIKEIFHLLEIEPKVNPSFIYHGNLLGIRGNLQALREKKRFLGRDLNRMLLAEETGRIRKSNAQTWTAEDRECVELIEVIEEEISKYRPSFTLILDFHTTTADGGIFTIAPDDETARQLALGLHAPVILGIAEKLNGTTISYFNQPSKQQHCIVFEAGQHEDPGCVHRSVAAIVNCMRSIGSVAIRDVDHRHDGLLMRISKGLPKVTQLIFHYKIRPDEKFSMKKGYENFQFVEEGEELAWNENGPIVSPYDGLILMPKYQSQGDDGFFLVRNLDL